MSATKLLLLSVLIATGGQVCFKKGMSIIGEISVDKNYIFTGVVKIITSPFVIFGLIFYAFSTILWLIALSKCDLNYAYPFAALTFILVMLASYLILHEAIPPTRIAGITLICLGFIFSAIR